MTACRRANALGVIRGQNSHSHRFLGPYYLFHIKLSDTLLAKAHYLEDLPRVLSEQRSRPAWYDLGIPKAYVVPCQPQPSDHRMLVYDHHIIGRSVRIVKEDLAVSFHCRCAWDPCLLQARQILCSVRPAKRCARAWANGASAGWQPAERSIFTTVSSQSKALQRARRSAGVSPRHKSSRHALDTAGARHRGHTALYPPDGASVCQRTW